MTTQDLIAGYAAYTDATELTVVTDQAPAITPTPTPPLPTTLYPSVVSITVDINC